MDNYSKIAKVIVERQESIIGPLAWREAGKVSGLTVNNRDVSVSGEGKKVLEALVRQYEALFGLASVEACKDAIRGKAPFEQLPPILQ